MRVIWESLDPLARMHTMTERKGKGLSENYQIDF